MKDFKSVMIGFLIATCMFLFMGMSNSEKYGALGTVKWNPIYVKIVD